MSGTPKGLSRSGLTGASGARGPLAILPELLFVLVAVGLGWQAAVHDFAAGVPLLLAISAFLLVRFAFSRPFPEAFALYVALAALNYYYFFCAKLTGRNPTDVGDWGLAATPLEKMQRDIIFGLFLALAMLRLFQKQLSGAVLWTRRLNSPLLVMTGLYMAYGLLRAIFFLLEGDKPFDVLFYLRANAEFAVLPFLMATTLLKRELDLRLIFKGILYTLPLVALLGIIEFFLNGSPYPREFVGGHVFSRVTATLQNPNNLGGYLVVALGTALLFFFRNQLNLWERRLFWVSMPLGLLCLFMTLSRSSILSFFLVLTVTFGVLFLSARHEQPRDRLRTWRNLLVGYLLILVPSILVLVRFFDFRSGLASGLEMYLNASIGGNYRLYAPLVALSTLMSNPLSLLFGLSRMSIEAMSDNMFANILMRNGLVGTAIFAVLWLKALWDGLFGALGNRNAMRGALYLACFFILVFQAVYGITAPLDRSFPQNMYFWLAIGTLAWLADVPRGIADTPAHGDDASLETP